MIGNPFQIPAVPASVRAPDGSTISVPTFPKIKAWSYSVVQQHRKCPLSVKFRKIDRLAEPDNEPQARGQSIHGALAQLVRTGEFPPDANVPNKEEWRRRLVHLHTAGAQAELQIAFDKDWNKVEWFGAGVWARIIIDALYFHSSGRVAIVHEFKTGKVYPEHEQQERLYALAVMKLHPNVDSVLVQCDYIDLPNRPGKFITFVRSQEKELEREFADFAAPLLAESIYPASPGTHCQRCHFRRSNAGPCAFG
jgi:CRISPR/Cas system-associated exonuclease Cas4 (RecB family)